MFKKEEGEENIEEIFAELEQTRQKKNSLDDSPDNYPAIQVDWFGGGLPRTDWN